MINEAHYHLFMRNKQGCQSYFDYFDEQKTLSITDEQQICLPLIFFLF
ncbi:MULTISPECIES: hypothetical protein [Pasteurellaceae]